MLSQDLGVYSFDAEVGGQTWPSLSWMCSTHRGSQPRRASRPRRAWDLDVYSFDAEVGARPGPPWVRGGGHAEVANLGVQPYHAEPDDIF